MDSLMFAVVTAALLAFVGGLTATDRHGRRIRRWR
jgi:hypothetical protein